MNNISRRISHCPISGVAKRSIVVDFKVDLFIKTVFFPILYSRSVLFDNHMIIVRKVHNPVYRNIFKL